MTLKLNRMLECSILWFLSLILTYFIGPAIGPRRLHELLAFYLFHISIPIISISGAHKISIFKVFGLKKKIPLILFLFTILTVTIVNYFFIEKPGFIINCIITPIVEEWFNRGYIINTLMDFKDDEIGTNQLKVLILSSIFFTINHVRYWLNPTYLLGVFVAGLSLGVIFLALKSLYFPMILHILINFSSPY